MEGFIVPNALEEKLEGELTLGDDSQNVEKMNQSFLTLKKKLLRSTDLIEEYSVKVKEYEQLKGSLVNAQQETERYRQQHLENSAIILKLTSENRKIEESNKKLEKTVSEQEIKIACDKKHIEQLICQVEDMDDRHSEKVMEMVLDKEMLHMKVKELETEVEKVRKMHENTEVKSTNKSTAINLKNKGKNKGECSRPFESTLTMSGLGIIDQEDADSQDAYSDSGVCINSLETINTSSICSSKITNSDNDLVESFKRDIGLNVNLIVPPEKPDMVDKNIMTDEFYHLQNNPTPSYRDKCAEHLEPYTLEAMMMSMDLPSPISDLPPTPPHRRMTQMIEKSPSPEKPEPPSGQLLLLNSLHRRLKTLEKLVRRQAKRKSNEQSCCGHSHLANHCNYNNNLCNQQSQFDMMTQFMSKMMQLSDFQKTTCRGLRIKQQKLLTASKAKDKNKKMKKKKKNESFDSWSVEESPYPLSSSNLNYSNAIEDDSGESFINNIEAVNYSENVSKTKWDMNSSVAQDESLPIFSPDNCNFESNALVKEENVKKRKHANISTARSRLLRNLKKLKQIKPKSKRLPSLNMTDEDNCTKLSEDVPSKKKRIAHAPKTSKSSVTVAEIHNTEPSTISIDTQCVPVGFQKRRMTRSVAKFMRNKSTDVNNKSLDAGEIMSQVILANNQNSEISTEEKLTVEQQSSIIIRHDDVPYGTLEDESPASPTGNESDEVSHKPIKAVSIYDNVIMESNLDEAPLQKTPLSDGVKNLRNRPVPINLIKPKELFPVNSSISSKLQNVQVSEKIESPLDHYLANRKKKLGRKPKNIEIAKAFQSKAETIIKNHLQNLIDAPQWDTVIHMNTLTAILEIKSVRTIAKAIVEFTVQQAHEDEPLDMTHTPPAPPMRISQQKVVTLINALDEKLPNLIDFIFKAIEYTVFRINASPAWKTVEELTRLFTVLARLKKDRERVRIMCCDALYCMQRKCSIILYVVMTSWPEVLPMYDKLKDQHLPITIVHVLRMLPSGSSCDSIKRLLHGLYQYPQDEPSDVILGKLMTSLEKKYDKSVEAAILLLAKREGSVWAYKNVIQPDLLSRIIEGRFPSKYHALKLFGFLLRAFPIADDTGHVKAIIAQLKSLAESNSAGVDVQEGIISALLSLSRHNFEDIAMTIFNWKPSRPLLSLLHEQLDGFFGSRGQHWCRIKLKGSQYSMSE